jgi:hypothetical protein
MALFLLMEKRPLNNLRLKFASALRIKLPLATEKTELGITYKGKFLPLTALVYSWYCDANTVKSHLKGDVRIEDGLLYTPRLPA